VEAAALAGVERSAGASAWTGPPAFIHPTAVANRSHGATRFAARTPKNLMVPVFTADLAGRSTGGRGFRVACLSSHQALR
jgi:hypothetical protein